MCTVLPPVQVIRHSGVLQQGAGILLGVSFDAPIIPADNHTSHSKHASSPQGATQCGTGGDRRLHGSNYSLFCFPLAQGPWLPPMTVSDLAVFLAPRYTQFPCFSSSVSCSPTMVFSSTCIPLSAALCPLVPSVSSSFRLLSPSGSASPHLFHSPSLPPVEEEQSPRRSDSSRCRLGRDKAGSEMGGSEKSWHGEANEHQEPAHLCTHKQSHWRGCASKVGAWKPLYLNTVRPIRLSFTRVCNSPDA